MARNSAVQSEVIASENTDTYVNGNTQAAEAVNTANEVMLKAVAKDSSPEEDDELEEDGEELVQSTNEIETGLAVKRAKIADYKTKRGKDCYEYNVKGLIKGKLMSFYLKVIDKDAGGYDVLDLLFETSVKRELVLQRTVRTDQKGKTIKSWACLVRFFFEDNSLRTYKVYPKNESDKQGIFLILQDKGIDVAP